MSTTIVQALERIKSLRDILYSKGIDLLLPNLENTENIKLETVVEAFNQINNTIASKINSPLTNGNVPTYFVDKESHVRIPSGYLKNDIIITGTFSLQDINNALIEAGNAIKKAISEDAPLSKVLETGKTYVKLSNGTYILLPGSIEVHTENQLEVPIKIKFGIGETIVESGFVPEGYYLGNTTKLSAVLNVEGDPNNKVVNVEKGKVVTNIPESSGEVYTINPSEGYDYLESLLLTKGSSSVNVEIDKNKVILSKNIVEGWVKDLNFTGDNISEENGTIIVSLPTIVGGEDILTSLIEVSEDLKIYITPSEGYYNGDISIELLDKDGESIKSIDTPEITKVTENESSAYLIVIPKGLNLTEKTINFNKASINLTKTENSGIISANISISEGYTENEENAIDLTNWIDSNLVDLSAEALFEYDDIKSEVKGTASKVGKKYFTSAKIDLSNLIDIIDNI